jgi:hypothetical protein
MKNSGSFVPGTVSDTNLSIEAKHLDRAPLERHFYRNRKNLAYKEPSSL